MYFNFNFFLSVFIGVVALSVQVTAIPMNQITNIVRPPITYPKAAVQWTRGTKQVVRWDTKDIPPQRNNTSGLILLGRLMNNSENLDINHPLARGFSISSGQQIVIVPDNIPCADNYIVVLFGDSGNRSPEFQIS